jgi:hypothetical protein
MVISMHLVLDKYLRNGRTDVVRLRFAQGGQLAAKGTH